LARSNLLDPLLGTITYAMFLATILLVPMNSPHPRRAYLGEYHVQVSRRSITDIAFNVGVFVPFGWGLHCIGRRFGLRPRAAMLMAGLLQRCSASPWRRFSISFRIAIRRSWTL
jgi:glycopeptide antibiotics resistance protein